MAPPRLANRERYIAEAHLRKKRLRVERTAYLLKFFESHPCIECGETDPLVLEFDHVAQDKVFEIAQSLPYRSWQSILDEIEKCDVVCANCHRRRTKLRQGSVRATLLRTAESGGAGDRT